MKNVTRAFGKRLEQPSPGAIRAPIPDRCARRPSLRRSQRSPPLALCQALVRSSIINITGLRASSSQAVFLTTGASVRHVGPAPAAQVMPRSAHLALNGRDHLEVSVAADPAASAAAKLGRHAPESPLKIRYCARPSPPTGKSAALHLGRLNGRTEPPCRSRERAEIQLGAAPDAADINRRQGIGGYTGTDS